MKKTLCLATLLALLIAAGAGAQGRSDYLNFESPPVKPVAVTDVGGSQYVLVTNTPNNTLDVFSISDAQVPVLTLVASVPTGLEPVSVVVKPTATDNGRIAYTTNWIGDSITRIELIPQGPGRILARLDRTVYVGDEPMHLTFLPELPDPYNELTRPGGQFNEYLLVVFGQAGFWGWFDPVTLAPAAGMLELLDVNGTQAIQAGQVIGFTPPTSNPLTSNLPNWLVVLNRRGGQPPGTARGSIDGSNYDFDMWLTGDPFNSAITGRAALGPVGGFGTTNFNMAFAANGDVYVVGIAARNLDVGINSSQMGEMTHLNQVTMGTGFAPSMIWRLRAAAVPPIDALDLNPVAVPYNLKVAQPTDVVVYEPPGGTLRVLVAGSSSDAIADITPTAGPPATWTVNRVDVAAPSAFDSFNVTGLMRGPRGLALRYSPTTRANDVVVIYNHIEHSLTTVPLNALAPAVSAAVPLTEPRPAYITANRKFLYSSRVSGSNTASCATCHIDAHTDQRDWNLSGPIPVNASFPLPGALIPPAPSINPGEKGVMVTQSLRGLVNSELQDQFFQDLLLTNKPYHWRGDRGVFDHFNGAFVGLLGIPNPFALGSSPLLDQGIPPGPPGLHTMQGFREFVNSIHYPPNPEQPKNRRYSGLLGTPNNPADGTLALRGLKIFHIKDYSVDPPPNGQDPPPPPGPVFTCVTCHILPEGSDNILTDAFAFTDPLNPTAPSPLGVQFLETAALRGLIEKEKRLFRRNPTTLALVPSGGPSSIVIDSVGLIHTGSSTVGVNTVGAQSIRAFVNGFSLVNPTQNPTFYTAADVDPVTLYMREFDTGVAPAVGLAVTLTAASSATEINNSFTVGELTANETNAGLVVKAEIGGVVYGFYYDPVSTNYIEVRPDPSVVTNPLPFGNQTRAQLIALLTGRNRMVLECVPLGNEERVAYVHFGQRQPPAIVPTPGTPTLLAMRPNTANQPIPQMTANWPQLFATINAPGVPSPHRSTGNFQVALLIDAATATPPSFGVTTPRHEPPRRFRISGSNIQYDAHLRIYLPGPNDFPVGHPQGTPPNTAPTPATHLFLELPIHAHRQGSTVTWETAVELDPQFYYGLLTGASSDPIGINWMLTPATIPGIYTPGTLNPILRNWLFVQVVNQPNSAAPQLGPGSWQRLTI